MSKVDWVIRGVCFPEGTRFKTHFKGVTYKAVVKDGAMFLDKKYFKTPSSASMYITRNNSNGWGFWECLLPNTNQWVKMSDFREEPKPVKNFVIQMSLTEEEAQLLALRMCDCFYHDQTNRFEIVSGDPSIINKKGTMIFFEDEYVNCLIYREFLRTLGWKSVILFDTAEEFLGYVIATDKPFKNL